MQEFAIYPHTSLHVLRRFTESGISCRDEVFELYGRVFRSSIDPEFMLMYGNSGSYRDSRVDDFEERKYSPDGMAARSPDLKPL